MVGRGIARLYGCIPPCIGGRRSCRVDTVLAYAEAGRGEPELVACARRPLGYCAIQGKGQGRAFAS